MESISQQVYNMNLESSDSTYLRVCNIFKKIENKKKDIANITKATTKYELSIN